MSIRLENVGDLNVSNTSQVTVINSSAISGQVQLLAGTAWVGTINTIAIGGAPVSLVAGTAQIGSVSLLNPLVAGTAYIGSATVINSLTGIFSIANSTGWVIAQSNTEGLGVILRNGSAVIGTINLVSPLVAGTAVIGSMSVVNSLTGTFSIVNSSGWVMAQSNTEGVGVILRNGSAVIGTINLVSPLVAGTAVIGSMNVVNSLTGTFSIVNSSGWVFAQSNTEGQGVIIRAGTALIGTVNLIQGLLAGTALIGTATVVNSLTGTFSIVNSSGWSVTATGGVSIVNSAGWVVNPGNTVNTTPWLVNSPIESARMSSSNTFYIPQFATFDDARTNSTIIAASAGLKLRVLSYEIMAQNAVNARWESGTGGTTIKGGTMYLSPSGGMVAGFNPVGWFQTDAGSGLNLKLATAISVGGCVTYITV